MLSLRDNCSASISVVFLQTFCPYGTGLTFCSYGTIARRASPCSTNILFLRDRFTFCPYGTIARRASPCSFYISLFFLHLLVLFTKILSLVGQQGRVPEGR